jgi:hypothetical protein
MIAPLHQDGLDENDNDAWVPFLPPDIHVSLSDGTFVCVLAENTTLTA